MGNTAAVQVLITINGKSITAYNNKKNVISLKVSRVIGDAANQFTLELFDETAWKIESALYGTKNAPISIVYGASDDWANGKHIAFVGNIITYNLSFSGAATILSIEGIVYGVEGIEGISSTSFWFKKATVNWVDTNIAEPEDENIRALGPNDPRYRAACMIDGKSLEGSPDPNDLDQGYEDVINGEYADYICARIEWIPPEQNGTKTEDNPEGEWTCRQIVNPSNIFKRIIKKYNGQVGNKSKDGVGEGSFILGDCDPSLWVDASSLDLTQTDEPASSFITNVLCKIAIKPGSKSAGFKYYVKDGKHYFKAIDYDSETGNTKVIKTGYYVKESEVLSFSLDSVGAIVMAGSDVDDNGNPLISISAIDSLTGDVVTTDLSHYEGHYKAEETMSEEERQTSTNWYFANLSAVKIVSSSSQDLLDAEYGEAFEKLKQYTMSASLTIWGEYNNDYVPGNYLDLTVMTPDGKQHYSTGRYFIVSSEDSITSDGYTTTLRLLKNTDKAKNQFETETNVERARAHFTEWYGQGEAGINSGFGIISGIGSSSGDVKTYQSYAKQKCLQRGWSNNDFSALVLLWQRESSWNPKAENSSSGAYGIPQMNPSGGHSIARDPKYRNSWQFQIDTGLDYIAERYETPSDAWNWWQSHRWY